MGCPVLPEVNPTYCLHLVDAKPINEAIKRDEHVAQHVEDLRDSHSRGKASETHNVGEQNAHVVVRVCNGALALPESVQNPWRQYLSQQLGGNLVLLLLCSTKTSPTNSQLRHPRRFKCRRIPTCNWVTTSDLSTLGYHRNPTIDWPGKRPNGVTVYQAVVDDRPNTRSDQHNDCANVGRP